MTTDNNPKAGVTREQEINLLASTARQFIEELRTQARNNCDDAGVIYRERQLRAIDEAAHCLRSPSAVSAGDAEDAARITQAELEALEAAESELRLRGDFCEMTGEKRQWHDRAALLRRLIARAKEKL